MTTEQVGPTWGETHYKANGDRVKVLHRMRVEYYDDNPRMYVRHERKRENIHGERVPREEDGVWNTVAAWELHPDLGVTQVTDRTQS